jgi:AraC-like DNA-binding protein
MQLESLIETSLRLLCATAEARGQMAEPVRGLWLLRQHECSPSRASLYEPVICLVLQGRKEVLIGDRDLSIGPGDCFLVSHDLSVQSRITHVPYLALVMDIDIGTIRSLRDELGELAADDAGLRGAEAHQASADVLDALRRYLALAESAADAKVLGPLVFKEIHYRLLLAPLGATLRSLVRQDTRASAIARAITLMRGSFRSPIAVPELARQVGMSASTFHKHFLSITSTTPLQYLKDVRLLEAQRLLRVGGTSVTAVAFDVGYVSPSQFTREYTRKFGVPPSHDAADDRR